MVWFYGASGWLACRLEEWEMGPGVEGLSSGGLVKGFYIPLPLLPDLSYYPLSTPKPIHTPNALLFLPLPLNLRRDSFFLFFFLSFLFLIDPDKYAYSQYPPVFPYPCRLELAREGVFRT